MGEGERLALFMAVVLAVLVGVVCFFGGIRTERVYQCDRVGGQMVGDKACIKGHEVLIQWPT